MITPLKEHLAPAGSRRFKCSGNSIKSMHICIAHAIFRVKCLLHMSSWELKTGRKEIFQMHKSYYNRNEICEIAFFPVEHI